MKKIFFFLFLFICSWSFTQELKANYVCTYKLDYSIKGKKEREQFIMFIDADHNRSFFQSSINYVLDTVNISDPLQLASYESDFNEKVLFEKKTFKVYENIIGAKFSYSEEQNLNWQILDKVKKEDNVILQLAKTNAYGRVWYAWFSKEIPIDFGPYKFNGLPGLIVSVVDEKNQFIFTLQTFKKKNKKIKLPKEGKYRYIPKSNFNQNRFRIQTADNGVVIFSNPNERKEWIDNLEKRYKSIPLLDVQYPVN